MNEKMNEDEYLEIDLRKYLYLIWQKKFLLISIVILAVLTTAIVNIYFIDKEYTATSTVKLGNLGPDTYTEPAEVKKLIKSRSFINKISIDVDELLLSSMIKNDNSKLEVLTADDSDYISISLTTTEAELSAGLANELARIFIEQGSKLVEKETALIEEYRANLAAKSEENMQIGSDLTTVSEKVKELETDANLFETNYLLQSIISLEKMINESDLNLESRLFSLEQQLLRAEKPELMTEAVVPENPSSPNIVLNIAIALILSLMAGIFLIFSIEFFKDTDWKEL